MSKEVMLRTFQLGRVSADGKERKEKAGGQRLRRVQVAGRAFPGCKSQMLMNARFSIFD